jgi:hypothetical protein
VGPAGHIWFTLCSIVTRVCLAEIRRRCALKSAHCGSMPVSGVGFAVLGKTNFFAGTVREIETVSPTPGTGRGEIRVTWNFGAGCPLDNTAVIPEPARLLAFKNGEHKISGQTRPTDCPAIASQSECCRAFKDRSQARAFFPEA